ncbi:hypothetical protein [Vallitalea guaymasensis]|uniref:Uncharacterized protein n=1 Tax=Vallitalea guaymasensis TaxID=1185412 RepID=A0A8J8SDX8_9FIRM|nr:hypothetical protein [Vallitalea guaymasensis]QUH31179.1 hypothetical protein HYG85_20535 [Vallitalea guaymasensis]
MKKLILSNLKNTGIIYILLFVTLFNIIALVVRDSSYVYIISLMITLSYFYTYMSVFFPQTDYLDNTFLLQRSLPLEINEIINSWYYTVYITNGVVILINLVFLIIIMDSTSLSNLLVILLTYFMMLLCFNIVAPCIIKTTSILQKIVCSVITLAFLLGTYFFTYYLFDMIDLMWIVIIDAISSIIIIITFKISTKHACNKLLIKFDN